MFLFYRYKRELYDLVKKRTQDEDNVEEVMFASCWTLLPPGFVKFLYI